MPAPAPFPPHNQQLPYPALYLYPLNDSFIPKHISLLHNQRVKIGRQTNAKTAPGERNGYFDSKVLSRQHAEVWEDTNKIYIKDVKSSNGTFINGERLSPEGLESEPYELKSDDIVEFGIDIVGEDNKTIIHHKVAARVVCVFSEQEVQVAARAEQHQAQQAQQSQQQHYRDQSSSSSSTSSLHHQPNGASSSSSSSSAFNFAGNQAQRRPQLAQQGIAGMGGMGGSMRPPGKSGLTFDHILSRLQGELQKSRETGAELHTLTGAMNEIHDTLGGNLPPNLPPYPQTLPPVRPGAASSHPQTQPQPPPQSQPLQPQSQTQTQSQPGATQPQLQSEQSSTALVALQTQLQETQSSLNTHVDKVRALEGVLAEQDAIRREMRALREMMERRRGDSPGADDRDRDRSRDHEHDREHGHTLQDEREHGYRDRNRDRDAGGDEDEFRHDDDNLKLLDEPRGGFDLEDDEEQDDRRMGDDDDDDVRSIATVVPHELERVDEEDEDVVDEGEGSEGSYEDLEIERGEREHELRDRDHEQEGEGEEYPNFHPHSRHDRDNDPDPDHVEEQHEEDSNTREASDSDSELDGDGEDDEASRRRRNDELGRPRTPEPMSLGMGMLASKLSARRTRSPTSPLSQVVASSPTGNRIRTNNVDQVLEQVGALMALTTTLEAQHAAAQSTIAALESKVVALEAEVRTAQQQHVEVVHSAPVEDDQVEEAVSTSEGEKEMEKESLMAVVSEWTKTMEGKWSSVQEDWGKERERLNQAREDWEAKARMMDSGLERLSSLSVALQERERELRREGDRDGGRGGMVNGDAVKHEGMGASTSAGTGINAIGLVTPPSPRSLSSDSGRSRRRRRGRGGGGRGSRSLSPDTDTDVTLASEEPGHDHEELVKAKVRAYAYGHVHVHGTGNGNGIKAEDGEREEEEEEEEEEDTVLGVRAGGRRHDGAGTLATPESSVYKLSNSGESENESVPAGKGDYVPGDPHMYHMQTAIGVLLLSVAAAAVIWRVKPET